MHATLAPWHTHSVRETDRARARASECERARERDREKERERGREGERESMTRNEAGAAESSVESIVLRRLGKECLYTLSEFVSSCAFNLEARPAYYVTKNEKKAISRTEDPSCVCVRVCVCVTHSADIRTHGIHG